MSEEKKAGPLIKIYKLRNTLKTKLGLRVPTNEPGHLAENQIDEAQELIASMCKDSYETIGKTLEQLSAAWKDMQDMPQSEGREEKARQIFTLSHEIKDIGSLCGYSLAASFAESLRDYIAETALNLQNQRIIIQAHVDALHVVYKGKLRDDGGPAAEELKKMVKIAIEKYR